VGRLGAGHRGGRACIGRTQGFRGFRGFRGIGWTWAWTTRRRVTTTGWDTFAFAFAFTFAFGGGQRRRSSRRVGARAARAGSVANGMGRGRQRRGRRVRVCRRRLHTARARAQAQARWFQVSTRDLRTQYRMPTCRRTIRTVAINDRVRLTATCLVWRVGGNWRARFVRWTGEGERRGESGGEEKAEGLYLFPL
jgi:hypothetical protein